MIAKAKRNKNISKEIEICDKKIVDINNKIVKYKEKIARYQEAMDITPKDKN